MAGVIHSRVGGVVLVGIGPGVGERGFTGLGAHVGYRFLSLASIGWDGEEYG